jgi:hypothetical protein
MAEANIAEAERLTLSDRDSLRVLVVNPPAAPDRLVHAVTASAQDGAPGGEWRAAISAILVPWLEHHFSKPFPGL